MRESLAADAESVKLRDKSPHFYETGLALSVISASDDALKLPAAIKKTLSDRLHRIVTKSHDSLDNDVSAFVNTLTDMEQQVFWAGYEHVRDKMNWRRRFTSNPGNDASGVESAGAGGNKPKRQRTV